MQDSAVNPRLAPQHIWAACHMFREQPDDKAMFAKAESALLELSDTLDQLREAATILTLTAPPHRRPRGLG